jgi:hypothetical protein
MENKEKVHVDEKLFVNEATLELIRRRIESESALQLSFKRTGR